MTNNRIDKLSSILFIILCLNSILYYEIQKVDNSENENTTNINPINEVEIGNQPLPDDNSFLIKKETIPGNFITKGYFSYEDAINSPESGEGEVYQWEDYDVFHSTYSSVNLIHSRFSLGDVDPYYYPPSSNTYYYGYNYFNEYPYLDKSVMYSPVFTENTTIANKVYYLLNVHRHRTAETSPYDFRNMDITYKITLYHFFTSNQSTTEITSVEFLLDTATYTTDSLNYLYWKNYEVSSTLDEYTIPVGDRLKVAYQLKFQDTSASGHITTNVLRDGEWNEYGQTGTSVVWDIVDGIYSNTYTFPGTDGIFGVQLYMREETYPNINFYSTAENNTVYTEQQDVNIAVTPGSISSYRWDEGSWIPFATSTTATLPAIHGYHNLTVSASDPIYSNTRVETFRLGYDATFDNLIPNGFSGGETYEGGHVFDFSALNVLSVNYSWDGNLSPIQLNDPYDITAPLFNGLHTLQVNTSDFYKIRIYNFQFYFDSLAPEISLSNVNNSDFLLGGKTIKVKITDYSLFNWLKYRWDTSSNQTWTYDASNVYNTNMPSATGIHTLRVYAEDIFGHQSSQIYTFNTDNNVFFIDLIYMEDGGYYQGGEDVDVQIQQTNGSVYYSWDGGSETYVSLFTGTLTLSGPDALNTTEGLHTLTIRTFDYIFSTQYIFNYNFWVDGIAPQFDTNYLAYNNTRNSNEEIFYFYVSDNYIDNDSLIVQYSVNEGIYRNFDTRFIFRLSDYTDGGYTLDVRAQDSAGNVNVTIRIYFTIDTTSPVIYNVVISSLYNDFNEHGNYYVSANPFIEVTAYDTSDPNFNTYYSWNGSEFVWFSENFTLSSSDLKADLVIKANDTVGNEVFYTKYKNVIYDSSPPVITTLKPSLLKINNRTLLEYNIADSTPYSIENVEYEWDVWTGYNTLAPDLTGYFSLNMSDNIAWWCDLKSYSTVVLRIVATDILGNTNTTEFTYGFDLTPPTIALYTYDGSYFELEPDNATATPVQGGTILWYDASVNDDLYSFTYRWDENESSTVFDYKSDPYSIYPVPDEDGYHILTVTLKDDTGINNDSVDTASPNVYTAVFSFFVDDIDVKFDSSFFNGYKHSMLYNDSYEYNVTVTDPTDGSPIPGLKYKIDYYQNLTYPMIVQVNQINSTSYKVTIWAISVTNDVNVTISVRFYQTSDTGGQPVRMDLNVKTREGILTILQDYETSIQYEDYITVSLYLEDNLGINKTYIEELYINNTRFTDYSFNESTYLLSFNYSSHLIKNKGNFSLEIFVKSSFYYDNSTVLNQISFEITPLPVLLTLTIYENNYTILEGTPLRVIAKLTFLNGTPIRYESVTLYLEIFNKTITTSTSIHFAVGEADLYYNETQETNSNGEITFLYTLTSEMNYTIVRAEYMGSKFTDTAQFDVVDPVVVISLPIPEEFPKWLLYTIIAGSIGLAAIISFIIYKLTRPKSFEELLNKVTPEEMALNYSIMSPGVILTIFDQRKGPIPLVGDHSLDIGRYIGRMVIGVDNFLLKIADQAYSSLGFEEHDAGRRVGSIILPTEKMTGFVHGIQIPNKMARGGFENLSLIVLADSEYGSLLLNYQDQLYNEIDVLDKALKAKKPLKDIEELVKTIRIKSVQVMIAAQAMEEQQSKD